MPIQATVILDSGCFLPMAKDDNGAFTEIGYFGSSKSVSDIRVVANGIERKESQQINLGKNCCIEVRHMRANGELNTDGVRGFPTFHKELLHMTDLYGKDKHQPVLHEKFDCVIRFDSGHFCGALIKPRYFEEYKKQRNGSFVHTKSRKSERLSKPVAHNISVHFKLDDGEWLELARDGEVFWAVKNSSAEERLEIEIGADNMTAEKFYREALKVEREDYRLPNQSDPPPNVNNALKISPLEKELKGILLFPQIDIAEIKEIASLSIEQVDTRLQEMGLNPDEPLPERLSRFAALQREFNSAWYAEDSTKGGMAWGKVSIPIHKGLSGIEAIPQIFIEFHGNAA
jgi:hypothetical protein